MNTEKNIVTRFAPSPTGYMHVGGARSALYAWAFAKKNNGSFILRIEDTDKAREVEGSIQHIMDSLKWIGITWNEGPDISGPNAPYIQSERLDSYIKYAKILIEKGLAYADPYTQEELEAFRKKAEEEKRPFLYRDHRPENPPAWDGTKALRLKTPEIKSYTWNDLVRGELSAGPEALDDLILIKSDGYPTYNFAHIIDDLLMGVTHIFRADEFISSTPKFLSVYEALGIEHPEFVTLPPILGADGNKKLGKRDGAKDILDYKTEGYLPEAMLNFLAYIGWNPGTDVEIMTPDEFVTAFDISGIQHAGGRFNPEKLLWTNKEHIKNLSSDEFKTSIKPFFPEEFTSLPNFDEILTRLEPELRERISFFGEIQEMYTAGDLDMFFKSPTYEPALLFCPEKQRKGKEVTSESLTNIFNDIKTIFIVAPEKISAAQAKELVWQFAEEQGRGIVLHTFRVALSGKERSPDPFSLTEILGKKEVLKRINYALENLNENT